MQVWEMRQYDSVPRGRGPSSEVINTTRTQAAGATWQPALERLSTPDLHFAPAAWVAGSKMICANADRQSS